MATLGGRVIFYRQDPAPRRPVADERNLLVSTLAVAGPTPFHQQDWTTLRPRVLLPAPEFANLFSTTLFPYVQQPFRDLDLPRTMPPAPTRLVEPNNPFNLPQQPAYLIRAPLSGAIRMLASQRRMADELDLLLTTLGAPAAVPFSPVDWTTLRAPAALRAPDWVNLFSTTLFPFVQRPFGDVPLARPTAAMPRRPPDEIDLLTGPLAPSAATPFSPMDWAILRAPGPLRTTDWANLFSTTLFPYVQPPFREAGMARPMAAIPRRLADELDLLTGPLAPSAVVVPFVSVDWLRPGSPRGGALEWATNLLESTLSPPTTAPFSTRDFGPVRVPGGPRLADWVNLFGTTLFPYVQRPFAEPAMVRPVAPAPRRLADELDLLLSTLTAPAAIPFLPGDWGTLRAPGVPRAPEYANLFTTTLFPYVQQPFRDVALARPAVTASRRLPDEFDLLTGSLAPGAVLVPFVSVDWVRPAPPRGGPQAWPGNLLESTLGAPAVTPFSLGDWPTLRTPWARRAADWVNLFGTTLFPYVQQPFREGVHGRPAAPAPRRPTDELGWTQIRQQQIAIVSLIRLLGLSGRVPFLDATTGAQARASEVSSRMAGLTDVVGWV